MKSLLRSSLSRSKVLFRSLQSLGILLALCIAPAAMAQTTITVPFTTTGTTPWVVPPGVTSVSLEAWGGGGGGGGRSDGGGGGAGGGGGGAFARTTISVTPGQTPM